MLVVTDQATADYDYEQQRRAVFQDDWAEWAEAAHSQPTLPDPQFIPTKVCAQCVNWQPERMLNLADGTIRIAPGFCTARAAADLPQMSQGYAKRCRFYKERIPF